MMEVRVKLFATLGQYAPNGESAKPFVVEVDEGAQLHDLFDLLNISEESVRVKFVNGRAKKGDYELKPDDEVGLFPPIGGG